MKATQLLHNLGQSLWLDNITRDLLNSGTLKRYIGKLSVSGLTSNPTIFDHAIKSSSYDVAIREGLEKGKSGESLFFDLALDDLTRAADLFRPIHDRTNGVDGWVSLEVSPLLAHDTTSTIAAAKKLFARAGPVSYTHLDVYKRQAETVGVEHRGGYYDHAGALRDMVQNHLMQLLCLVAMEPMVSFQADEIRNKKVDVLHAARPILRDAVPQSAVRGQYGSGNVAGKKVPGYRDEQGVAPDSKTETFAALKLFLDNWRWQDVPFYLRTGKRLLQQASEISIQFRAVPHRSFPPEASLGWQPSRLVLSIQPDEGIVLGFQAKYPGPKMQLRPVDMRFSYRESFAAPSPNAYETLLWDVMKKDATLFMRADQVEAAWELLMPVLEAWQATAPSDFPNYAAGTWGPEDAQRLLAPGHRWPLPTELVVAGKKKGKNS